MLSGLCMKHLYLLHLPAASAPVLCIFYMITPTIRFDVYVMYRKMLTVVDHKIKQS